MGQVQILSAYKRKKNEKIKVIELAKRCWNMAERDLILLSKFKFTLCIFQRKSTYELTAIFSPISDPMVFRSDYHFTTLPFAIPVVHKIRCCRSFCCCPFATLLFFLCYWITLILTRSKVQHISPSTSRKKTMFLRYAGTCKRNTDMPKHFVFPRSTYAAYFLRISTSLPNKSPWHRQVRHPPQLIRPWTTKSLKH